MLRVCSRCRLGLIATPSAARLLAILRQDQLNAKAMDWQRRGYYEELDMARANYRVWTRSQKTPAGWNNQDLFRERDDFLRQDYVPSIPGCSAAPSPP